MKKTIIYLSLCLLIYFIWQELIPITITNNHSIIVSLIIALFISFCIYKAFELKEKTSLILASIAFLFSGLFIHLSNSKRSENHLKSNGIKTTAFIQKKDSYYIKSKKGKGVKTYIYNVDYKNQKGELIKSKIESYDTNVFSRFSKNDSIDIIYSEKFEGVSNILEGKNQKIFLGIPMKDIIYDDIVQLSSIKEEHKVLEFLKKRRKEWELNNDVFVNKISEELLSFNNNKITYESKIKVVPIKTNKIAGIEALTENARDKGLLFIESKDMNEAIEDFDFNNFEIKGLKKGVFKTILFDVKYDSYPKNSPKKMVFILEPRK